MKKILIIEDNTEITIKLYDRFVSRFIDHAIPDCQISGSKLEKAERPEDEDEEDDEADDDSDYEDDQIEDLEDADQEYADNQGGGLTITIDNSQPILLSIRQLNRIYSTIPEDDYEINYGVLVKYHGTGGDIGIPSQVETIGKGAFEGCSGLLSISIPDTVKSIGVSAFKDCANLVEVDIPLHLLRVIMRDIGAYFGGTQFVDYLAQDGEIWRRYEEVRKALEEEKMVGEEEDELMSKPEDE